MTDATPQTSQNDISPCGQKSKGLPRGRNGGRPKGSGIKVIDWAKYQRLGLDGLSLEAVARQLGISRRTFERRKRQRQRDDSPM
jgi:transcriptional regulator GlxA family with amidase domain